MFARNLGAGKDRIATASESVSLGKTTDPLNHIADVLNILADEKPMQKEIKPQSFAFVRTDSVVMVTREKCIAIDQTKLKSIFPLVPLSR